MALSLLVDAESISPSSYLTACKRAVDTGDGQRVRSLIERAESCLSEPLPSLPGAVILHAYTNGHRNIAKDLIVQCTTEQIAAAPPNLLRLVAERLDFQTAMELVDKGVQPGNYAADVLHTLTGQHQEWMAEKLLEHGMPVEPDNYAALYVCVKPTPQHNPGVGGEGGSRSIPGGGGREKKKGEVGGFLPRILDT